MNIDMAILREWAEAKVSGKYFATDHDLPVARHILDAMPTPTMADVEWDNYVHAGLCAEHPQHGVVRMMHEVEEGETIDCILPDMSLLMISAKNLTPLPGTRLDLTPRREPESTPDHPTFLSSVEDYDDAPEGTIVATWALTPAAKIAGGRWRRLDGEMRSNDDMSQGTCHVLRWGWGA